MFTEALFTIAKMQRQSKCPLTDEWIKKIDVPTIIDYYSALKKYRHIQQNG